MPHPFAPELLFRNCHEFSYIYVEFHCLEAKNKVPIIDIFVIYTCLATGNSCNSLHYEFLLGVTCIHEIARDMCEATWGSLLTAFISRKS